MDGVNKLLMLKACGIVDILLNWQAQLLGRDHDLVGHRTNKVRKHQPDNAQEVSAHIIGWFKTELIKNFEFVIVDGCNPRITNLY